MTKTVPREPFHRWWRASKYMQVIYSKGSDEQIAWDGWQAALMTEAAEPAPRCDDHYDKQGRQCILHKYHEPPHVFDPPAEPAPHAEPCQICGNIGGKVVIFEVPGGTISKWICPYPHAAPAEPARKP